MVNYVLRLRAGENGLTQQLTPIGTALTSSLVSGVGPGIDPSQLTLSGHSLGGYLSQVYQRIFGSAGVYTFNALGVTDPNAAFFDQVIQLLGLPPGSFSSGPGENLLVPGEPAQLIGTIQGNPQVPVFSETQTTALDPINTIPAHRMPPLTDSLAVYDLFAKIDPTLNTTDPAVGIGKITDILKVVSNKPTRSLEAALDSLKKLFKDPATPAPAPTATDNREQYYSNLFDLQGRLPAGTLTIDSLVTTSTTQLASLSQGSEAFAYRYALKELNPFAVVGDNTLYDRHNQTGELNLYDPASTVRAGMTTQYIADRAQMLVFANTANTNDANAFGSNQVTDQVRYTDFGKVTAGNGGDFVVFLPGGIANFNGPNTRRVTFGGDSTDSLVGRDNTDRLYGGGGTDILSGNGGNDYLEGGSGLDVYTYNAFSGLLGSGNDGADTILDTDGKGVLRYVSRDGVFASPQATVIADASVRVSGLQWNSTDGRFTYLRSQDDLLITVNTPAGGSLTLRNFKDGDFGIRLFSPPAVPQTTRTIEGDRRPAEFTQTVPANFTAEADWRNVVIIDTQFDANNNPISHTVQFNRIDDIGNLLPGDADPNRIDNLNDSAGNDLIQLGGGNDIVQSARGGEDWVQAGAGRDTITTGDGKDLIESGSEADVIQSGGGDDRVYALSEVALATAIQAAETDAAQAGTRRPSWKRRRRRHRDRRCHCRLGVWRRRSGCRRGRGGG